VTVLLESLNQTALLKCLKLLGLKAISKEVSIESTTALVLLGCFTALGMPIQELVSQSNNFQQFGNLCARKFCGKCNGSNISSQYHHHLLGTVYTDS